jgi:pimeloyl-ACP methyl ester carboxylesterase
MKRFDILGKSHGALVRLRCFVFAAVATALFVPAASADTVKPFAVPAPTQGFASVAQPPQSPVHGTADKSAPDYFDFKPDSVKNADVVVVSVCGLDFDQVKVGPLQYSYIKAVVRYLFPEKGARGDEDMRWESVLAEYQKYVEQHPPAQAKTRFHARNPDNYLESSLEKNLAGAGKRYLVVPLRWNRNADTTYDIMPELVNRMKIVYAAAAAEKKPVYVVCHSWGTLIMHSMLNNLAGQLRVEKFVTLGSPLVPGSWWLDVLIKFGVVKEGLPLQIQKPGNVGEWFNFWAKRDSFSNVIPAADINVRVDEAADPFTERLLRAEWDQRWYYFSASGLSKVKKDESMLEDNIFWHDSYWKGYRGVFKTIDDSLAVDVFDQFMRPAVFAQ